METTAEQDLVAFVVGNGVTESTIRGHLADVLPVSMIPARIILVAQIPRAANGKVQRDRLPRPAPGENRGVVAMTTALDRLVDQVWRDALGLEAAAPLEDFFAAGGTSLTAIRVLSRLRTVFEADLALSSMFRYPRFDDFTAYLRTEIGGAIDDRAGAELSRHDGRT